MLTKTRGLKKKKKMTKTCRKYHNILRVHHVKPDYHVVADKFIVSSKGGLFQNSKYAMRREHQLIIQTIVAKYIKLLTKVKIPLKNTVNSCSIAPVTIIIKSGSGIDSVKGPDPGFHGSIRVNSG
jgi:hypothetical protein